jgi:hypothetical protein
MDISDIFHVAVLPPGVVESDIAQKVAAIIRKNMYETHLLLSGKMPKIITQYNTLPEAEAAVQGLRGLGLRALVCTDGALRHSRPGFRTHTLSIEENRITFRDKSGKPFLMEAAESFLILAGKVETRQETEVKEKKSKLNLPATLITGGIPIRRKVTETHTVTSIRTECFLRIYNKESSGVYTEMRQYDFDYGCLGLKLAPTSLANFNALTTKIREVFPQALFDDRMIKYSGAGVPDDPTWGRVDILCKLIYLFHQISSDPPSR